MKILLLLNSDIYCVKALRLLLPSLGGHEISVLLSRKVGNLKDVPLELLKIKEAEGFAVEENLQKIRQNFGGVFEFVDDVNSKVEVEKVREMAPQLIISIRFGQILRQGIIQIPQFGVVNLHSGILPAFRGVMASLWAILHGEKEIGTTLHYIEDATIDTGRVIAISRRGVDFSASLIENILALYEEGCGDIIEFLKKVERGEKIELVEQKDLGDSAYYSYPAREDLVECAKLIRLF
jgi:methionyl-tRNA formyltransferase